MRLHHLVKLIRTQCDLIKILNQIKDNWFSGQAPVNFSLFFPQRKMKANFSKEAKISVLVGIILTSVVLVIMLINRRNDIYTMPHSDAKASPSVTEKGSKEMCGGVAEEKEMPATTKAREFNTSGEECSHSKADKVEEVKKEKRASVPFGSKSYIPHDISKRVAFIKRLRILKGHYGSCILTAPREDLKEVLKTNANDAEQYLLDEFSSSLFSFYEVCVKAERILDILNTPTSQMDQLSDSEVCPLLLEALDMNPPLELQERIQTVLSNIDDSQDSFYDLFAYVRINPAITLEELPSEMASILAEINSLDSMKCPSDVENAVRVLFDMAQLKKRVQKFLDKKSPCLAKDDIRRILREPNHLGFASKDVERLKRKFDNK